jgi:citrate synthase
MQETATIQLGEAAHAFPVVTGTYAEKAVDIGKLLATSGHMTIDVGFKNTASTQSSITFIDGDQGILEHRGYPIEQLADHASFLEVAYLLLHGELPARSQLDAFEAEIQAHTGLPAHARAILDAMPDETHPMGMMSVMFASLSGFYPECLDSWSDERNRWKAIYSLLANMPLMVAYIYRRSQHLPYLDPKPELGYVGNFLYMMSGKVDAVSAEALDTLLVLHADHEQNCSTSTVRFAGSSHVNLFGAICAGNNALWGPLHGGANQEVLEMLEDIRHDGGDTAKYIAKAKDKNDPFRLMGFGHRVYRNYDPRARVIKKYVDKVLSELNIQDPLVDIARKLEEAALQDSYFADRKLFPNVDFYSGIIYRALGIPVNLFTVMFAFGRLPGWISQWKEMRENNEPIVRPRQVYTGAARREFVPIEAR